MLRKRITINVISESAFMVQPHGVHTAFLENREMLSKAREADLHVNAFSKCDLVHIHTVGPYALIHLLFSKGKKVVTAHLTPDTLVGSVIGAQRLHQVVKRYLVWFYNKADGVFAMSEQVLLELNALGVKKPVYVVPNTIDPSPFRTSEDLRRVARERLDAGPNDFVVLSVGQIQPRKRVADVVECARLLPGVRFIWVGGILFGPFSAGRRSIKRLMQKAPDNVIFVGKVDRKRIVDFYHAADLFFFPSACETFGMVIIEAAAAGLPLLLRDLTLYQETFSGAYVPGNEATFSRLIKRFASDNSFRLHWRARSATLVASYDSMEGTGQLMRAYRAILGV